MSHKKILIIALGFCAFVAAGAAGFYAPDIIRKYHAAMDQRDFVPPAVPKLMTEDFASTFQRMHVSTERMRLPEAPFYGPDGTPVQFSDFKGKPLLVNLWATWCPPCIVELPSLQKFKERYGGEIQVIGISYETGKDEKTIGNFLEKRKIGTFAAYNDKDGALSKTMDIRGLPTSFLVGRNGDILYRFEGDTDWASPESTAFFDVFILQNR